MSLFRFKKNIGLDLGSDTTQIYLAGRGIVVNEPSIVAFNNQTNRVIAVGEEAKKMLSRTPAHITALRPIASGVIADFDMAKEMLRQFLKKAKLPWSVFTNVIAAIPTNLTEVERKSVEDLLKETGSHQIYLIEQPLAAAFGSHLEIDKPTAYLIVDIGAGTTDMAVISLEGVVVSKRLKIGGNYFNSEIIKAVRDEFKLVIGEPTAEEIKIQAGNAMPPSEHLEVLVRGRDLSTGLPKEVTIKDSQVRLWLNHSLKLLVEALKDLIEMTPPELVGDVYKNGIYCCGGDSRLRGIDKVLEKEIGVAVKIIDDPLTSVVRGTGIIAENINAYRHLLNTFSGPKILKA